MLEVCTQHVTNVLGVREIQSSIDLIQNIDGSWLEEQQSQDERESHQRSLASTELCQALLPHISKGHFYLKDNAVMYMKQKNIRKKGRKGE